MTLKSNEFAHSYRFDPEESERRRAGWLRRVWHSIRSVVQEPKLLAMSAYNKQSAFLRKLVILADTAENRALCEKLSHAERSEKCLMCACRLVGLIALLGMAGLGYASVLLPEFFDNSTHVLIRLCSAVGLGSCLCFAVFLGLWHYYRRITNRIHSECRMVIMKTLSAKFASHAACSSPVVGDEPQVKISVLRRTGVISGLVEDSLEKAS